MSQSCIPCSEFDHKGAADNCEKCVAINALSGDYLKIEMCGREHRDLKCPESNWKWVL